MFQSAIIPRIAVVVLAGALVVGAVVGAANVDESFGWNDALGFSLFLVALEVAFFTMRACHKYQYS